MLVLTRREGEEIQFDIGDGKKFRIKVLRIRGRQVRIAIDATGEVQVHRPEKAHKPKEVPDGSETT